MSIYLDFLTPKIILQDVYRKEDSKILNFLCFL